MTEKATSGLLVGMFAYIVGQINMITICLIGLIAFDLVSQLLISWKRKDGKGIPAMELFRVAGIGILWLTSVLVQLSIITEGPTIGITIDVPYITIWTTFLLIAVEVRRISIQLKKLNVDSPGWMKKIPDEIERKEKSK